MDRIRNISSGKQGIAMVKVNIVAGNNEYCDALSLRKRVFMDEQHVPEELEIDEFEETATHFVAYNKGETVGAGRCRSSDGSGKVERICVSPSSRKQGIGRALMQKIEEYAQKQNMPALTLHAQTQAIPFYKQLGYEICSNETFLDAGIPHVSMKKSL